MRYHTILAIAALVTVHAPSGYAQQYAFQYYGVDQGLTDLAVRSLYQDTRGFLWLSTENGVFRYDAERFRAFGPADGLPASNGATFGDAPDGSLLVGGRFGLYRQDADGRFQPVPLSPAKVVAWRNGIQSDGEGKTYVATDAGLIVITQTPRSKLQWRLLDSPPHAGSSAANAVLVEHNSVWWACGSELCRAIDGQMTSVFGASSGLAPGTWFGIRRASNGDLWLQSTSGEVVVMRKGATRFETVNLVALSGFGPRGPISVDPDGHIIIPVGDGLAIEDHGRWRRIGRASGLRGPVYALMQDREGSVWLGLAGHGLAKWLGYGQWQYFNSDDGLGSDLVYQVTPAGDGAFWAGTDSGLFLGRQTQNGWHWKRQFAFGDSPIHSVTPDGSGRLWLGTESKGAARFDPKTGKAEWFRAAQGLDAESPYTVMLDREDRIWAASLTGLFVADARTLRFRAVAGIPPVFCVAVVEDSNGMIWAGTRDGLYRWSSHDIKKFTTNDGLSNNEVLSLAADKNGDVWVGYQFGSQIDRIHMDNSGLTVVHEKGAAADSTGTTYFLGFDVRGGLWAGTNRGVDLRSAETMHRAAGWSHYDHLDGLVWDDCNLNGFRANPDGTVWIGTSAGLALFSPRERLAGTRPPVTILTRLNLGKKSVGAGKSMSVSHTMNSLTVGYSALTFARQDGVTFRYKLAPLFNDWRETRERDLEFPGLPPDSYRFEVQARDGWGTWSSESATFAFEVLPPYWRSWWFISLCALSLGVALTMVFRLRGNSMRAREASLRRLVDNRTAELRQTNENLQFVTSQLRDANENLTQLSTSDGLTGIFNRRVFDLMLEREWRNGQRTGAPLSIILVDVDYFKRLNDSRGHQVGDECLKRIARTMDSVARRGRDCAARYGGEEFALLLPGTDEAEALGLAEIVRVSVEMMDFAHPDSPIARAVTVSAGVATSTRENCPDAAALVKAADSGLYAAKAAGRNRVVPYNPANLPSGYRLAGDLNSIQDACGSNQVQLGA